MNATHTLDQPHLVMDFERSRVSDMNVKELSVEQRTLIPVEGSEVGMGPCV